MTAAWRERFSGGVRDAGRDRLPREALTSEVLKAHLLQHRGNVARAAKDLDMSRGAIYRLMDKYGIEREPEDPE